MSDEHKQETPSDAIEGLLSSVRTKINTNPNYNDDDSDSDWDIIFEAIDEITPRGEELWKFFASNPQFGTLYPPPGTLASIEDTVRTSLRDEMEYRIINP